MKKTRSYAVVGKSAHRVDSIEKVTGKAIYTGDIELPGMAYAKILRSPVAHAKLVRVDAARAYDVPGVIAVLTRDDLGGLNYRYGATYKDQCIVAVDKVRYVGDPVAAVLAEEPLAAEEALDRIEVEYEDLPHVDDLEQALAEGAPLVHEEEVARAELRGSTYGAPERFKGTNVCYYFGYERGDLARGFEKADHVFEDTFRFHKVQHCSLEPHTNIAYWDGEKFTVWSSCQDPFTLRDHLSAIFSLPLSRVRVIVPYVGGGYGGKLYVKAEPITAALSWKTRRPVKLVLSFGESFKTVTRHAARVTLRTGVTRDGKLVARECRIFTDTGAYADAGPRVTQKAGYRSLGPYRIPNARIEAHGVYTNTIPAGAFRGFGSVQVTWAYESQMDLIAERLGIDPVELRLKNLLRKGEVYTAGDTPVDCDLKEGLLKVAEAIKWNEPPSRPNRGKGIAMCMKDAGGTYKVAGAAVRISSDGSAVLLTGTVEIGQGPRTALSQIVAEELAMDLGRISVAQLDTDVTPYDISTSASSSTVVMGLAVQRAAQDARKQLLQCAAKVLKRKPSGLVLRDGAVHTRDGRSLPYGRVIVEFFGSRAGEIIGRGLYRDKRTPKAVLGSPTTFWEVAWGGVELEVDTETGAIQLLNYVSATDVGKAINPEQVEGQDEGAVMFGVGHTLLEELVYDSGQPLNANLVDYRLPTFGDLPQNLTTVLIENGNGPGPFGAKGMGEGGLLPLAPAIAGAVSRAVGVRIQDLPLTPPKVWTAIQARRG
ncbi:MAG TPA: xanthine dehydrogenase family protein molybdopterin-binding subunit [candidate division Zixibacteria bacterium]|nr:xanthine dehydrogenase family protein molybdopterin-binding subunit [candidate division Zixibacteria bacterium]